ncbi:enterotoxin [Clostridium cuniculi]|uniref:enterotoxin n=1 Tax=Clostridium cuniculi TaxID=2548455 RepID=UPI00105554D4|nr:enterotoxin [Clostridium cuniculi]
MYDLNSKSIINKSENELDDGIYLNIKGDGWVLSSSTDKLTGTLVPPGEKALFDHSLTNDESRIFIYPTSTLTKDRVINILINTIDLDITSSHENKTIGSWLEATAPSDKYLYMTLVRTYIRYDVIKVQNRKVIERAVIYRPSIAYADYQEFNQGDKLNDNSLFDSDRCLLQETSIIMKAIESNPSSEILDGLNIQMPLINRFYPNGTYILNRGDGYLRKNDVDFYGGLYIKSGIQCTALDPRIKNNIIIDRFYKSSNSPYTKSSVGPLISKTFGTPLFLDREARGYWHTSEYDSTKDKYMKMYIMRSKYEVVELENNVIKNYALLYKQSIGTHKLKTVTKGEKIEQKSLFQVNEEMIAPKKEYYIMELNYEKERISKIEAPINDNCEYNVKVPEIEEDKLKDHNLLFKVSKDGYYRISIEYSNKSCEIYKLIGTANRNYEQNKLINYNDIVSSDYKGLEYILGDKNFKKENFNLVYLNSSDIYCIKTTKENSEYKISINKNTTNLNNQGMISFHKLHYFSGEYKFSLVNKGKKLAFYFYLTGDSSKKSTINLSSPTLRGSCKLYNATTININQDNIALFNEPLYTFNMSESNYSCSVDPRKYYVLIVDIDDNLAISNSTINLKYN